MKIIVSCNLKGKHVIPFLGIKRDEALLMLNIKQGWWLCWWWRNIIYSVSLILFLSFPSVWLTNTHHVENRTTPHKLLASSHDDVYLHVDNLTLDILAFLSGCFENSSTKRHPTFYLRPVSSVFHHKSILVLWSHPAVSCRGGMSNNTNSFSIADRLCIVCLALF